MPARTILGHIITKASAVVALLRGDKRGARVLWRWMANQPTAADLVKARADVERPHVKVALEKLRREARDG